MCESEIDKIKNDEAQKRLDLSCYTGDVERLYESFQLNREILDGYEKKKFVDTPLHEAAKRGHIQFCAEMMNLMPSYGKKLNPNLLSPLHLALQYGHEETALALVHIDKELVRVMTPLMICAKSADYTEVLAKFLRDCPQSIYDENTRCQTAVHVAMESNNCKGGVILLNWIRRSAKENVLLWKDDQGNSPLHLAALHKCVEGVEIMVEITLLNKRNHNDETPFDIANKVGHPRIIQLFKKKEALTSNIMKTKPTYADYLKSRIKFGEKVIKSYYYLMRDLNTELRHVVLVVAALIATATYTAILQPPGGVYQAEATPNTDTTTIIGRGALQIVASVPPRTNEGRMVMKDADYERFMPANTMAFTLSIMLIIFVLPGRPDTIILHACLMVLSYISLIGMLFVSHDTVAPNVTFFMCWSLIAFAFFVKMAYYLFVKGFFKDQWWMPHCFMHVSNAGKFCTKLYFKSKADDRGGHATELRGVEKTISLISKLRKQYKLTTGSSQ